MKCPVDGTELNITDRQGVEIDYCPQCRGVWLDRGELDKIIERMAVLTAPAAPAPPSPRPEPPRDDRYRERYNDEYYKKKRKKNFFDDLFDF